MNSNQRYHHLNQHNLAHSPGPRGLLRFQHTPGKGVLIALLVHYIDLTRPKDAESRYAFALVATLPPSAEELYQCIASANIRQHGRNDHAQLAAALDMLNMPTCARVFQDTELLQLVSDHLAGTNLAEPMAKVSAQAPELRDTNDPGVMENADWAELNAAAIRNIHADVGMASTTPHRNWQAEAC
ncbi:MAG: hypothetical protein AWU57_593 [Marinobacter sp. T13-3]|nr:MAG: hypothetical protein AWU57_593 [Marinobacter sp. T13-3]